MIWLDPMMQKREAKPVSKDPVILMAIEALKSNYGYEEYKFGQALSPTCYDVRSSTGVILPSNFDPPGGNYDLTFGDIICEYVFDYMRNPGEIGPYICAIGDNSNGIAAAYLHNMVFPGFMSPAEIQSVAQMYPGINVSDLYPDTFPVAIVAIVNADGTLVHVPLETNFINDGWDIQITYSQDVCDAMQGAGRLTETVVGYLN